MYCWCSWRKMNSWGAASWGRTSGVFSHLSRMTHIIIFSFNTIQFCRLPLVTHQHPARKTAPSRIATSCQHHDAIANQANIMQLLQMAIVISTTPRTRTKDTIVVILIRSVHIAVVRSRSSNIYDFETSYSTRRGEENVITLIMCFLVISYDSRL